MWTTGAHFSDFGILLARTNPTVPKHAGISFLIVDMTSPGIDIRPLKQIDGAVHFNEVFFTDVEVPVENVIGEIDAGWGVAMTTLTHERTAIGGGGMVSEDQIVSLAKRSGAADDPVLRDEIAQLIIRFRTLKFLGYRVRTAASQGKIPGQEASVAKLAVSELYERIGNLVMAILGSAASIDDPKQMGNDFSGLFLSQWQIRIGGGTDQIQKNIVGERVLGLPRQSRPDKAIPFNETLR